MRTQISQSVYPSSVESPPQGSVWTTERRVAEKAPPGAPPRKKHSSGDYDITTGRSSLYSMYSYESSSEFNSRLLLPSRTIQEDDEYDEEEIPFVSIPFRPTRLFGHAEERAEEETIISTPAQLSTTNDPTTVLLVPGAPIQFDSDDDETDDLSIVSPRLLRFGRSSLSRYEAVDIAESDESECIFRRREDAEEEVQSRYTLTPTLRTDDDGDRV